ncbi:polyprenol reductase-like isoform X3 [Centruroides sculpturatus]|nr:polyprenol reductase-like isoform X3 [Centruroides sculpturatus]
MKTRDSCVQYHKVKRCSLRPNPSKIFKFAMSYGKTFNENDQYPELMLQIPKRWFRHFYVFASIYHTLLAWILYKVYFQRQPPPLISNILVRFFLNTGMVPSVIPEAVVISMVLILLHVYRRFYECYFVSVFSNAKMNLPHYIFGYCFYFGVGLSLLSEAPGFTKPGGLKDINFSQSWLKVNHLIGITLFLWAWYNQHKCFKILAELRKNNKGAIVSAKYLIPNGHLFENVTNPHYLYEIILYFAILIILGFKNITWWLLMLWIITSHILMAISSHKWYKENFPKFALTRKAIIPYILWFQHLYVFAGIYHIVIAWILYKVYFKKQSLPLFINMVIKLFLNAEITPSAIPEAVVISLVLMLLQIFRRFYESYFISVFSNAKMNLIHYIFSYCYYFGVGLSLLSEAPGFTKPDGIKDINFSKNWLKINHLLGVALFFWAWNNQHKCLETLAELRKDKKGTVTTTKYSVPEGHSFDFVTNPHYLYEIIIYFAILIVLGFNNVTWWLLFLSVFSSHIFLAAASHKWYQENFPKYAKSRKAIIPYVF